MDSRTRYFYLFSHKFCFYYFNFYNYFYIYQSPIKAFEAALEDLSMEAEALEREFINACVQFEYNKDK